MNFAEAIAQNPPRLVVQFRYSGDGTEQFQWGVVGSIPILTLIGRIIAIQDDIIHEEWMPECSESALVITWHREDRTMLHFCHIDIPRESLVGMLETIKHCMVASRIAQHAVAQRVQVLGPDGKPMMG